MWGGNRHVVQAGLPAHGSKSIAVVWTPAPIDKTRGRGMSVGGPVISAGCAGSVPVSTEMRICEPDAPAGTTMDCIVVAAAASTAADMPRVRGGQIKLVCRQEGRPAGLPGGRTRSAPRRRSRSLSRVMRM